MQEKRPTIDVNLTTRAEIVFAYLNEDNFFWTEFILVDVDRSIPGSWTLVFECRFRPPATAPHHFTACDIRLSFEPVVSDPPTAFLIPMPLQIIATPLDMGIEVVHTSARRTTFWASISDVMSLRAGRSQSTKERYSLIEKETCGGVNRGSHVIDLRVTEDREAREELSNTTSFSIRIDKAEGVTSIHGFFSARVMSKTVHVFGFTSSHLHNITRAPFTLSL